MIQGLRIWISRIFAVFILALLLLSDSIWLDRCAYVRMVLFLLGTFLVGIASLGRLWCCLYIGGYKADRLVTQGPYSMCRNPLYFFSFIGSVGVGLTSETFMIPALVALVFALYYPMVIRREEAYLKEIHLEDYTEYTECVPSFFPRLSGLSEPEEYLVKPLVFKRHLFDAFWFVWLIGIIKIISELHELHILPTLFSLY